MTLISTQLIDLITQVGFPIAAFIMMFLFSSKTLKENTDAINRLTLYLQGRVK